MCEGSTWVTCSLLLLLLLLLCVAMCRADLSAAGLERSCGLMVNYKYVLADVTANNRAYLVDQRIAAAVELRRLLD